ncbi:MAG: sialidase family protein, partial [Acidimicrobiales bacterium]
VEVVLTSSTDGGATFSAPAVIDRRRGVGIQYDSAKLFIDPASGAFYTVQSDQRLGTTNVWFRRSADRGATWSQAVQVDRGPRGGAFAPVMSVAPNGRIDLVFYQRRAENRDDVKWAYSTDGGVTFSTDRQINERVINRDIGYWNELGDDYPPAVASTNSTAVAAWVDTRFGTTTDDNQDTFIRLLTPGGAS